MAKSEIPSGVPADVWALVEGVPGLGGGHEMKGYMHSVRMNAARAIMADRNNRGLRIESTRGASGNDPLASGAVMEDDIDKEWGTAADLVRAMLAQDIKFIDGKLEEWRNAQTDLHREKDIRSKAQAKKRKT